MPSRIRRFRILEVLGAGSFGRVYRGRDDELRRDVAIKVPTQELLNRHASEQWLKEAQTIASLEHPHIVPVYDVGATYDVPCFIVTKYIEGIDFGTALREQAFDRSETLQILVTIARALHYAHRQGVIHRDVKPENILIDSQGEPFVVDF